MYALVALTLLAAPALGGYIGTAYHGPEAKPVVLSSGHLADTHEVAAAKQQHLGALQAAHGHGYGAGAEVGHHHGEEGHAYHGPAALPKVLPDGHIADTHEVAAAKQAHLSAVSAAKSYSHHYDDHHDDHHAAHHTDHHADHHADHHFAYHGPLAKPVVLPSGHLADTHEVAAAKQHHADILAHSHH